MICIDVKCIRFKISKDWFPSFLTKFWDAKGFNQLSLVSKPNKKRINRVFGLCNDEKQNVL